MGMKKRAPKANAPAPDDGGGKAAGRLSGSPGRPPRRATRRGRGSGCTCCPSSWTPWPRTSGCAARDRGPDGFDLSDAARELARLAGNHNAAVNPDGRTPAQEKGDWVAVGGLGADLGNMADEPAHAQIAEAVRAVAYEVCYLACDYLF